MADDLEKTEEPTPKKLEDARKEGNVPKSQDVNSLVTLVVAIASFFALFPFIRQRMFYLYRHVHSLMGSDIDKNDIYILMISIFKEVALMILPLATIVAISGVLASVLQFGFLYTTKPLVPDFSKLDPIK